MKVVGFNASPRAEGNTAILLARFLGELEREGIETETIRLSSKELHGCVACYRCFENQNGRCAVKDDAANGYIEKMLAAQGIVLSSPVYFQDVTPEMKALIDRAGFVARANGNMLRDKLGASLAAFRRSGGMHAVDSMNHFFLSTQITIVGRVLGVGRDKGDVERDEEGLELAKSVGAKMASLLKKLHA